MLWAAAFDDDDRARGAAADRARLVVELDGERALCAVHANGAAGVDAPERDGLAADGDLASGADAALDGDRLGARARGRAGRGRALQAQHLFGGERVGPDPEQ